MNPEDRVSERTRRLAKKFHVLDIKDEKNAPLKWYAWPHDQSREGIVMAVTANENIADNTANIIGLYGVVNDTDLVSVFRHEPNHAYPQGFFTVCIDSIDVNEATLDNFMPKKGSSPHP